MAKHLVLDRGIPGQRGLRARGAPRWDTGSKAEGSNFTNFLDVLHPALHATFENSVFEPFWIRYLLAGRARTPLLKLLIPGSEDGNMWNNFLPD